MIIQTTALSSLHLVPSDTLQKGIFPERHRHRHASQNRTADYLQKVGASDQMLIQIHAESSATFFRMHFYNQEGRKVKTRVVTSSFVDIAGNTVSDSAGNTVSLRTFTYRFSFAHEILPDGIYTIVCEVNDGTWLPNGFPASVRYLISEPVWVKAQWPGTVLLSYRNRINENDFVWEQTAVTGQLRVNGTVREADMESYTETYKEGNYNPVQLSSYPSTSYELSTTPLPLFLREKLHRIFACSEVTIDGRRVVKKGDPQQSEGTVLLRTFSQVFESHNPGSEWVSGGGWGGVCMQLRTSDSGRMQMPNLPFPYVAAGLKIGSVSYGLAHLVQEPQDLQRLVDSLNSATIATYGLGGHFMCRDGIIGYISNGIEAKKDIEIILLTDHVEMTLVSTISSNRMIGVEANGEAIAIQPDTGSNAIVVSALQNDPGTEFSFSYSFPTGKSSSAVRVFTGRKTTGIKVDWDAESVRMRPGNWTSFSGVFRGMIHFNLQVLSQTGSTLQIITLQGPLLKTVSGIFILGSSLPVWSVLKSINIQGALPTSSVNSLISSVSDLANQTGILNGNLKLDGQAPPAPPTGSVAAAISNLQMKGWTVFTD